MQHDGSLEDLLKENDLQKYHSEFVSKLGVTAVDHLSYVQSDDVKQLGMSQPEWRRLRASMKKAKKRQSKVKPNKGNNMSKAGHEPTKQTSSGGHIIPASSLDILDRELGRGEFGKVMQGIWTNSEGQKIQVAIKCLSPEKVSIDKHQQDFLKEAAIMYSLNHDHLVKLFGVVLDVDSSLMLVTEFAPLRSLAENIKQEALKASFPVTLLVDFSIQIADAMRYLHSSNIIHRDLATRNILLFINEVGTKTVKISDFGLSRRLLLGENYRSEMRPNLKLPLAWMPVEALTKLTFTKASDVYSFGVTMWEMFSYGCQPWTTKSGEEILKAIDKPNFQRLERPEACPKPVYDIMLKCWSHQAEDRPTFADLRAELPNTKPQQVRAVLSHVASSPDELTFRTDDIITVIESSDKSGMWTGVSPLGKVGKFECTKTTAANSGPDPVSPARKRGSKVKRGKSGKSKEVKKRIAKGDIGVPSNYQHIFHVGCDGQVEGDPTFGGADYSNIPVASLTVEKSPQTKRISRPTQLPPSVPPVSKNGTPPHQPAEVTKASPETLEPLSANAAAPQYINQVEASPDILHGTSDAFDGPHGTSSAFDGPSGKESNHNDHAYQNGKDSPATPDEFSSTFKQTIKKRRVVSCGDVGLLRMKPISTFVKHFRNSLERKETKSFEMGSLLEECLSAWESVDSQLKMKGLETAEETNGLEGERVNLHTANRTTNNNLISRSSPISINQGGKSREVGASPSINLHDANDTFLSPGGMATPPPSASSHPDSTLNLHNMIIKDRICTQSQTKKYVPRKSNSMVRNKVPGGERVDVPVRRHSETPVVTPHTESIPTHTEQIPEGTRFDKKWDSDFKRLSTVTPKSGSNEYLESLGEVLPSTTSQLDGRMSLQVDATFPPAEADHSEESESVGNSSRGRKTHYEELSKALSPDPNTYSFKFISKETSSVTRSSSMNEPGLRQTSTSSVVRSQSFKTEISEQGLEAYNMLIGGDISGSTNMDSAFPAVPPKPSRNIFIKEPKGRKGDTATSSLEEKVTLESSVRSSSSESSVTEIVTEQSAKQIERGQRRSVSKLRSKFEEPSQVNKPQSLVPPIPPREPVSPMHQITTNLKSSHIEGSPTRIKLSHDISRSPAAQSPIKSPVNEPNNNDQHYRLSAKTLERLEQEQPQRRRRRSRRSSETSSDGSKYSPSKRPQSSTDDEDEVLESPRSDAASSPQRSDTSRSSQRRNLPDLPEYDQTNSTHHNHHHHHHHHSHTTPPIPPRVPPIPFHHPHANSNIYLDSLPLPPPVPAGPFEPVVEEVEEPRNASMTNMATHSLHGTPTRDEINLTSSQSVLPSQFVTSNENQDVRRKVPPPVKKRNFKSAVKVPPKPPSRVLRPLQRSRTVDSPSDHTSSEKKRMEVQRSHTVSVDRDFYKRAKLKSAAFDPCILDQEDNHLRATPRFVRGILELQGHSFEEEKYNNNEDTEPSYPPPPVPADEIPLMTDKHRLSGKDLIPDPKTETERLMPEPLTEAEREALLQALGNSSSIPLSESLSAGSDSNTSFSAVSSLPSQSSLSLSSSRSSFSDTRLPETLTPVKIIPKQNRREFYNMPRKVPDDQLLRYNIKASPVNRVSFSTRMSGESEVVREQDYEILVFQQNSANGNIDPTYESMSGRAASPFSSERYAYMNSRSPKMTRASLSRKKESDSTYAEMSTDGGRTSKSEVRRVRSMEDLLGSGAGSQRNFASQGRTLDEQGEADNAATSLPDRPPPAPPLGHGHTFESTDVEIPGYIKMKGSTGKAGRSASVCVLSDSLNKGRYRKEL